MELSSPKNGATPHEAGTVQDLRSRVDGEERFRSAWFGYQRRQVDAFLREQNTALAKERQAQGEQLAALRQEIGRLQAVAALQQEQQTEAERYQSQLEALSAILHDTEEQLRESEAQLTAARQGDAEAQRLSQQLRELSTENLQLANDAEQLRCQLAARDQLADQLRQKNRELEAAAEQAHQQLLTASLNHSRGLDGLRSVQNDCVATLSSQLQCCQELLERYHQGMEDQLKLVLAEG